MGKLLSALVKARPAGSDAILRLLQDGRTLAIMVIVYIRYALLYLWCFVIAKSVEVQDQHYWYEEARIALRRRLVEYDGKRPHARNVILLMGDGLGLVTLTASRIFKGQKQGKAGEGSHLAWEKFPAVALSKTYNLDAQIGESSACATALLCGVKANFETVGLDGKAKFENCYSSFSSRVESLFDWAQQAGKSTGIVTNTRVTHATPAALYAHSASRYWEDDGKVPPVARKSCKDITRQLIEDAPGRNINVLLGGGRRHWLPKVARDYEESSEEGRRLDGRNLIEDWIRDKKRRNIKAEFVWNKQQMDKVDSKRVDHLLGLFAYSHMDFEADRDQKPTGDPSLADMTMKSLSILQKNPKGFVLFVESGRIDHAHHYNNPYRALNETLMLESALVTALSLVDPAETLIVMTSDHSHVLTMGGLATPTGNPILGTDTKVSDIDGLPYSTLLYGNGPGYSNPRVIPSNITTSFDEQNAVHGAAVPRQWATHGGEDVPVYAQGPLATTVFSGTVDQSYIPHGIAYIACLGEHSKRCLEGVDNYTFVKPVQACVSPVANVISTGGRDGVVLASSVMSDDTPTGSGRNFHINMICAVLLLWTHIL
uniref:alkaline phosphatase n=1 Tax=Clastoptera arizonana TaxID=38151 RepID=A0A1B6EBV1_9HEMI